MARHFHVLHFKVNPILLCALAVAVPGIFIWGYGPGGLGTEVP